jgi:hypothetical protein
MIRRGALVLAAGVLLGCSDLSEGEGGVVALEVTAPAGNAVEVGDTVQYTARALNIQGEEVAAEIRWATPDTANISVDSLTGIVVGKAGATVGRVQASAGSLLSPLNLISVLARADTLILVSPDTMTVDLLLGQSTPALEARLESYDPAGPLAGRDIIYEIVYPVFALPGDRTVELTGGVLIDTLTTGSGGTPASPVALSVVGGAVAPDSAIVELRAFRYGGTEPVPGSGQRIRVRFLNP